MTYTRAVIEATLLWSLIVGFIFFIFIATETI